MSPSFQLARSNSFSLTPIQQAIKLVCTNTFAVSFALCVHSVNASAIDNAVRNSDVSLKNDVSQSFSSASGTLQQVVRVLTQQSKTRITIEEGINLNLVIPAIHNAAGLEQALQSLAAHLNVQVSGNTQSGYLIGLAQLPSTTVIANKDKKDKTAELAQISAVSSLDNLVRYQPLVSAPVTASGSGNVWDSNGNAGYNIRGLEGNRIGLEVDGIALPDAAPKPDSTSINAFAVGREYFDPEMMQEISIATGAQTAGNGASGLGGKVSFRSKSPQDFLNAQQSSYRSYKAGYDNNNASQLHTITGAWSFQNIQAMLVVVKRDGEQIKTLGKVTPNPDEWNSLAALAKLNWNISSNQQLSLTLDRFSRDSERMFTSRINPTYPQGVKQFASTDRHRFSLDYEHTIGAEWIDHLSVRAYLQDAKQKDISLARYVLGGKAYYRHIDTAFLNELNGLSLDAEKKSAGHALNYGVRIETSESQRPWTEDRLVVATGAHQITNKNRMADMDGQTISFYLNDKIDLHFAGQSASITPGLRADLRQLTPKNLHTYVIGVPAVAREIQEETSRFITPSLRLDMQHTATISSFAAFSRNTRPVSAAEKTGTFDSFSYTGAGQGYAILGNPKLKNERSHAFELGINSQVSPGMELQLSSFYNHYENFIEYALQTPDLIHYPTISFGLYRPENIGKAATWGLEISGQLHFDQWMQQWRGVSADFAIGAANGTATNSKTGKRDFLPSVAPTKASLGVRYDDPTKRFGLSLHGVIVDAKQAPNDVLTGGVVVPRFAIPSYQLFDAAAYWNLSKNIKLNLSVLNLGNQRYWDYANSRKLAAAKDASDIAALSEIERQVMPGRSVQLSVQLNY